MEKETMMSDKDLSWFLGVEDETENESTSQEATAVPEEKDQQTSRTQRIPCTPSLHGILRVQLFKDVSVPR